MYHTLAYAVKEGVRYATVHGQNCSTAPNACAVKARDVATKIQYSGVGLDPNTTTLTFKSGSTTDFTDVTLADCLATTCDSTWPVVNGTGQTIEIDMKVKFNSALAMFWPGSRPISFAVTWFSASSRDLIQF